MKEAIIKSKPNCDRLEVYAHVDWLTHSRHFIEKYFKINFLILCLFVCSLSWIFTTFYWCKQ